MSYSNVYSYHYFRFSFCSAIFFLSCLSFAIYVSGSPPVEIIVPENDISTRDDTDPYRLATTVYPESYVVSLKIEDNFGPAGVFEGNVSITLRTYAAVNAITLHANLLDIDTSSINLFCGNQTNLFDSLSNDSTYHFITIQATGEIANNTECTLEFYNFAGQLTDDMQGFYRSSYTNANGETE